MNINNETENPESHPANVQPSINESFFHGLAQMNFLQAKFSEDLKRHFLQSQRQISMLHKMVEDQRVKARVAEEHLQKLQIEKENINNLLRSACEHLREARSSHEEEKSKNEKLKEELQRVKEALKAKKEQYRECHRRYKKHKSSSREKSELLKSQSQQIDEAGSSSSIVNFIASDQSSSSDSQPSGSATSSSSVKTADATNQTRRVARKRARENCDRDLPTEKNIKIDPEIITV